MNQGSALDETASLLLRLGGDSSHSLPPGLKKQRHSAPSSPSFPSSSRSSRSPTSLERGSLNSSAMEVEEESKYLLPLVWEEGSQKEEEKQDQAINNSNEEEEKSKLSIKFLLNSDSHSPDNSPLSRDQQPSPPRLQPSPSPPFLATRTRTTSTLTSLKGSLRNDRVRRKQDREESGGDEGGGAENDGESAEIIRESAVLSLGPDPTRPGIPGCYPSTLPPTHTTTRLYGGSNHPRSSEDVVRKRRRWVRVHAAASTGALEEEKGNEDKGGEENTKRRRCSSWPYWVRNSTDPNDKDATETTTTTSAGDMGSARRQASPEQMLILQQILKQYESMPQKGQELEDHVGQVSARSRKRSKSGEGLQEDDRDCAPPREGPNGDGEEREQSAYSGVRKRRRRDRDSLVFHHMKVHEDGSVMMEQHS